MWESYYFKKDIWKDIWKSQLNYKKLILVLVPETAVHSKQTKGYKPPDKSTL